MIRALISRTSCQPLPEVGAGPGGKQGQSKVKFEARTRGGSCREMDELTDFQPRVSPALCLIGKDTEAQ